MDAQINRKFYVRLGVRARQKRTVVRFSDYRGAAVPARTALSRGRHARAVQREDRAGKSGPAMQGPRLTVVRIRNQGVLPMNRLLLSGAVVAAATCLPAAAQTVLTASTWLQPNH